MVALPINVQHAEDHVSTSTPKTLKQTSRRVILQKMSSARALLAVWQNDELVGAPVWVIDAIVPPPDEPSARLGDINRPTLHEVDVATTLR